MLKDLQFPRSIRLGAAMGPGFETDVVIEGGGGEVRNQVLAMPRREFDAAKACATEQQRKDLIAFFRIVAGRTYSFKLRDWSDYSVTTSEGRFTTLTATTFQMIKRYTLDGLTADQDVYLPETVVIYDQNGAAMTVTLDYTINDLTGVVTSMGSPTRTPTTWSGTYFVPVRFDTDRFMLNAQTPELFMSQNIPIVEVQIEQEAA